MEGIDAIRIVGEAKSGGSAGGHAWNKVIINDECYVVDITWTEIIRSSTTENLTHEYFMVSDEYIASTHMPHENRDKFFFFGCMKAPIKKLQGKFRYQILMRVETGNSHLIDKIYIEAEKYNSRNLSVFVEKNPNNLS
jgi:hypothetical protein